MNGAKFVDVSGIRTRYFEAGRGEPLLLVHGGQFAGVATALDWSLNFDALAGSFHVYAMDKIGQGYTDNPRGDSEYVIGTTAWHLHEFMKCMGFESAHLVGHSRGGYTVCRLALEHPELVKTLTIVDSGTLMRMDTWTNWYGERDKKAALITEPKERLRFLLAANSFGTRHITKDWTDDQLKAEALPKWQEAVAKFARLTSRFTEDLETRQKETHQWIRSGRLSVPTLLIWGFNDPSATLADVGLLAMNLILPNVPRSQTHILNHAGHYCFREQPEAFVAALISFINWR